MRNALVFAVLCLFIASASLASEEGRPDPTGQGRYVQFGREVAYPAARVINQLPAGATCAPAGELVGARVWNSTRDGVAILSELSGKAEVAVSSNGDMFLCRCVRGYNQLFLVDTPPAPTAVAPMPQPQPEPASHAREALDLLEEEGEFTPLPEPDGSSWAADAAVVGTTAVAGGAVGAGIASALCLDIGLSALAGTGVGAVVAVPLLWAIHHYRNRRAEPQVQPVNNNERATAHNRRQR